MTRRFASVLSSLWRSTASAIVLVLIIAALAVGVWIGRGPIRAAQRADAVTAATQAPSGDSGAVQEYTCSMHPQVRLRDPKAKCPICFMDLIPVSNDGGEGGERALVMSQAAVRLAGVQTTPVVRRYPTAEVRLVGRVDFDETRLATISAWFPGRIERLLVNYTGVAVQQGEGLAELYSPELLAAQEELRQSARAVSSISGGGSDLVRDATRGTLAAARDKLRLWGLTEEQILAIERAETPMERLTIHSPISGVVVRRAAVQGQYVQTGEEIYAVADLGEVWVRLDAFESQLPWLRYGQEVRFTSDAFPGETFTGRIAFIDPVLATETRTIRVRVNAPNPAGRLKPGMFVRAVVRVRVADGGSVINDELAGRWISPMHPEVVKDGPGICDICGMDLVPAEQLGYVTDLSSVEAPLVIPASAPLITGRRAVVYVRVPDQERPTFEGREIVLGPRTGDWYIVLDGLAEGEEVVTHGAFKVDSAMQIAAKPSMMDPTGGSGAAGHQHGAAPPAGGGAPRQQPVPEDFLFSLKPVYSAYFEAQEALAADDLAGFRSAVADLHGALGRARTAGVVGEPLGLWRRIDGRLRTDAEHVAHLADIVAARKLFEGYSKAIIEAADRFGHLGHLTYHRAFCPMAFDDQGAEWLQRQEQIVNPYFGASMLRCGEVRGRFEPRGHREIAP